MLHPAWWKVEPCAGDGVKCPLIIGSTAGCAPIADMNVEPEWPQPIAFVESASTPIENDDTPLAVQESMVHSLVTVGHS